MFESLRLLLLLLTPSSLRSAASYSLTHAIVFARFDDVMYFLRRLDSQFNSTVGQGDFILSKRTACRAHSSFFWCKVAGV